MKRLKSIFIVVAIFVSGMIVGGTVAGTAAMNKVVTDVVRDPTNSRRLIVKMMKHEQRLDDDQTHQVWEILNDLGADLLKAIEPVRPQVESAINRAEMRIAAVLKENQRPAFERFMKAAHERWQSVMTGNALPDTKSDDVDGKLEQPRA